MMHKEVRSTHDVFASISSSLMSLMMHSLVEVGIQQLNYTDSSSHILSQNLLTGMQDHIASIYPKKLILFIWTYRFQWEKYFVIHPNYFVHIS